MQSLEKLDLSSNRISVLEPRLFRRLNNLKELILHKNQIYSIREEAFGGLQSLRRLILSNNRISDVQANFFTEMKNLRELRLENNQISAIDMEAFRGLKSLEQLNLENNKISTFHLGMFTGLNNLTRLSVSINQITQIGGWALDFLDSIQLVALHNNEITHLTPEGVRKLGQYPLLLLAPSTKEYRNQWMCHFLCWLKHDEHLYGTTTWLVPHPPECSDGQKWSALCCGAPSESNSHSDHTSAS